MNRAKDYHSTHPDAVCLECEGSGIVQSDYSVTRKQHCPACEGTGKQNIKPQPERQR